MVSTSLTKEVVLEKVPFLWFGLRIGVKVTELKRKKKSSTVFCLIFGT